MDRTIARVLETKKIAGILDILLQNLIPGYNTQREYEVPASGFGQGLIDTTRGALGHWINVENSVISAYTIITPSAWNLSPQTGSAGNIIKGAAEQALLGTPVADLQFPVEVGRVVRSYDPCVSCATHAYKDGKRYESIRVV